ncbi:HlyD family secretion protein [Chitinibacteraceae bacterium HSL-7]
MRWIPWLLLALAGCSDPSSHSFTGYVEGEYVDIAPGRAGPLTTLLVERGSTVKQHAALFALDAAPEQAQLDEASARLASEQARLADLQQGKRSDELAVTQASLDAMKAELVRSEAQLAREEKLVSEGAVSRQQLDDTRGNAKALRDEVRRLEATARVDRLPARTDQISAQRAAVNAASATLEAARWQLGQKAQQAPADALVVDTLFRPGEWVAAGTPVVRLLPPANVKLRFFVPATTLGQIKAGQTVHFSCDGCKADQTALISYISPQAEYTPPLIYSDTQRAKLVWLIEARPSQPTELHPGQPVEVRL